MDSPVLSSTRWRLSPGRDQSQTTLQMLTAPGERRIVWNGEVETHDPEQRVQKPFGLAQREMVDEPQGQSGLDGEDSSSAAAHPACRSGLAVQAAIASENNHTVTSPRRTRVWL